jgi:hypothetical protein
LPLPPNQKYVYILVLKSFVRIPGKAKVFARVELIDFVNESEAEALLRLLPEERNQVLCCLLVKIVTVHV